MHYWILLCVAAVAFAQPPRMLMQSPIERPEPDGYTKVFINPPAFRWPLGRGGPYELQIARTADFERATNVAAGQDTFHRPPEPMNAGEWYWRVRTTGGEWGAAVRFRIPEDAVQWPIGSWSGALDRIPREHPRLWVRPRDIRSLREKAAGPLKDYIARWKHSASRYLNEPLPLDKDKPVPEAATFEARTALRVSSLTDAYKTTDPAAELAFLYLVTGDEQFGAEAQRRALAAARLDVDGYTSLRVSDFANGSIIEGVARVYDALYAILSEDERRLMREMLRARCARTFAHYRPALEQRSFNAHAWQRTLMQAAAGALAIYGEVPEAREWLDWSLRLSAATFPWWGGRDGGSAEGAGYYLTGALSSLALRDFFFTATGVDLAVNPWFRGNARYLIYSHPPQGLRSSFGDNNNARSAPGAVQKLMGLRLAEMFGDGCAAAYAGGIPDELPVGRSAWLVAAWAPFSKPGACDLRDLPPAAAFRDIGVVLMHSAMADPRRNIFFEFKSSPYGSHNHAHADQNSFNLAVAGDPLIVDSGYYAEYGDAHHTGYTVRTKAHNAILIDGEGQAHRNLDAYGQIARFEQGDGFSYALGRAAQAYHHVAMQRADRHVLWLQPGTFLIADDLAAEDGKPHRYEWLLHAASEMHVDEAARTVLVRNGSGRALVTFLAPGDLRLKQTKGFDPPPKPWMRAAKRSFPEQWHVTATPSRPAATERFLVAIQVLLNEEGGFAPLKELSGNQHLRRAWRDWLPVRGWQWEQFARER
jgi:hypothetical protein